MLRALDLTKSYDGAPLFEGLSLTLNPGDRAGLVGPNGAGKSTLLRLLAGQEKPDRGLITSTTPPGHLPQEAPAATVDDLLHTALGEAGEALKALHNALGNSDDAPKALHSPADLDGYAHALERAEATGAWAAEARAEDVRRRLDIEHVAADQPLHRLSGGEQARALLAATLLEQPKILLLDEPTNHLDADGLAWLEQFLTAFDGALLVVSHDRRFLDAVVTRIYELEPGKALTAYEGGYTAYRAEKARRRARLEELATAQDKRRRRLEADIADTRDHARRSERTASGMGADKQRRYAKKVAKKAQAREHRLQRALTSESWVERPRDAPAVRLKLQAAADRGRRVAALRGVHARVLHDVDLTLHGGERVAISGANGAGKTTLLQLLLGTLEPREGVVQAAATVRLLPQRFEATGPLLPWFRRHTRPGIDESEARTLLAHFGLDAHAIRRPLERLSPGQRARAAIAALVASNADLLLLDEPTNHLDFDTLETLDQALKATKSTVVAVSHDRWFLDAIGTTRHVHLADGRLYESSTSSRP